MSNSGNKGIEQTSSNHFLLNVIMSVGLCFLVFELLNLWKVYHNRDCLADVYQKKVRSTISSHFIHESSLGEVLFPTQVLSSKKVNEKKNICEVTLYHKDDEIIVRYRPKNHSSTFSAGRVHDTTLYYGVEILNIEVSHMSIR